jgi:hypothetical protein
MNPWIIAGIGAVLGYLCSLLPRGEAPEPRTVEDCLKDLRRFAVEREGEVTIYNLIVPGDGTMAAWRLKRVAGVPDSWSVFMPDGAYVPDRARVKLAEAGWGHFPTFQVSP